MRSSFRRLSRTTAAMLVALALLLVGAPVALAKEGVEVALAAPISPDAKPGDTVPVFFTLAAISETGTTPLRGSDVFIRLFGPSGDSTQAAGAEQQQAGLYKALIEIPAGGAARAEFGLHGMSRDAAGKTVASDIIWPYDGVLVAAAMPAPVQPDPATGGTSTGAKPGTGTAPDLQPGTATVPATAETGSGAATVALDPRLALAGALLVGIAIAGALALGRRHRIGGATA